MHDLISLPHPLDNNRTQQDFRSPRHSSVIPGETNTFLPPLCLNPYLFSWQKLLVSLSNFLLPSFQTLPSVITFTIMMAGRKGRRIGNGDSSTNEEQRTNMLRSSRPSSSNVSIQVWLESLLSTPWLMIQTKYNPASSTRFTDGGMSAAPTFVNSNTINHCHVWHPPDFLLHMRLTFVLRSLRILSSGFCPVLIRLC
jgi:hypothetical protein